MNKFTAPTAVQVERHPKGGNTFLFLGGVFGTRFLYFWFEECVFFNVFVWFLGIGRTFSSIVPGHTSTIKTTHTHIRRSTPNAYKEQTATTTGEEQQRKRNRKHTKGRRPAWISMERAFVFRIAPECGLQVKSGKPSPRHVARKDCVRPRDGSDGAPPSAALAQPGGAKDCALEVSAEKNQTKSYA